MAVVPTRFGPLLTSLGSAAGLADLGADVAEGVVGVGAERRDRRDAHDDDQGQHDGVLDRGRAVFVLQESDQVLRELLHGSLVLSVGSMVVRRMQLYSSASGYRSHLAGVSPSVPA